jgi:DNA-binding NtrC family response regulator
MQQKRVLVVEDEALVAMALEDFLSEAGFTVTLASDAASAVRKLEGEFQELTAVVTDIRMPGALSGWDVGKRARELRPDMPVVYCSGDKAADWSSRGVPNSLMLLKPFGMDQLVEAVAQLVTEAPGHSRPS